MTEATQQVPKAPLTAPAEWPGAFGIYKAAKAASMVNWQPYLILMVISLVISVAISQVSSDDYRTSQYYMGQFLSWFTGTFISVAGAVIQLRNVSHEKISLGEAVSRSTPLFWRMLLASLVVGAVAFGSLLLFIVPFFFVIPRLALYSYFLIDKNLGPVEAVKASWEKTRGHASKVWGIIGANIVFALLLFTVIGIPFAAYLLFMYASSSALLYSWIEGGAVTGPIEPSAPVAPSAS